MSSTRKWTTDMYHERSREAFDLHYIFNDCKNYVGYPPESVLICYGLHGAKVFCSVCGWNYCQGCRTRKSILCVRCKKFPCEGCKPLSFPEFCGWSGKCVDCDKRGVQTAAEVRATADVPPPPVDADEDVIIVEDEPIVRCVGVHTMTEVCVFCKWNCCKECAKPRRLGVR